MLELYLRAAFLEDRHMLRVMKFDYTHDDIREAVDCRSEMVDEQLWEMKAIKMCVSSGYRNCELVEDLRTRAGTCLIVLLAVPELE